MTVFYLSTQFQIPASGLYHYTRTNIPGQYQERRIRCNGQPNQNPLGIVIAHAPQSFPRQRPWHPHAYIDSSDWLEITAGPPAAAYLAFQPVADQRPLQIWQNALQPDPQNANNLALPTNARMRLPFVSACRRREGYQQVLQNAAQGGTLRHNAELFWQAGADVCLGLVEHLDHSLGATASPGDAYRGLAKFNNPDWVFQLNRVLSEGFIEGHAQFGLTTSRNYRVGPNSTASWGSVLTRAENDVTIANINQLSQDEQQAMNLLADAVIERYFQSFSFVTRDMVLGWILRSVTPGTEPTQEFAFWHLHYPHWHKDLVFALRLYGPRSNDEDWDTFAQIIMRNYPLEGTGLSWSDLLMGLAFELAEVLNLTIPDWITFIVEAVLRNVQQKSGTPLACP
jgi:hypothetical protein